ncbi:MAG: hypothetical protein CML06_19865 [Pseudomonadales bacterium]|nr:hypothetical protein [Pseudomonadales bacterium]
MKTVLSVVLLLVLTGCGSLGGSKPDTFRQVKSEQALLREQLKIHYDRGEELYQSGQLDAARKEFEAMLALRGDEPNANYRLGTIAFKQRRFDQSANYFAAVIAADPKHYKAHYNLASIRLMQAENHFKYYAALVDPDADIKKVSRLMADIDRFTRNHMPSVPEQTLDQLAGSLKK